ncbi:DUF72 domain-containing protein [Paenibacillus hamazuiensis]|uniref:DUF72 domain-containing protein n=1 Tax=Paenibacillus hamazuiensis TaxID=2936508 RepID=UPI002010C4A2
MLKNIRIGLTGWGDHDDLYTDKQAAREKLRTYSAHFPVVEVDSSFYAVQPVKNYEKWAAETPPGFGFIVKAYQGMTGHARGESPFADKDSMFAAFRESIRPLIEAGKLKAVLFQYPPWFECVKESVDELRYAKDKMKDIPLALEFRNQSWFTSEMRERTLAFMTKEGWIHSVCDEPQAGVGSVPTVLQATHPQLTVVRFHGRNAAAWNQGGGPNWREVRYLYRYSREELLEWKDRLELLAGQSEEVCVVFNNNSGGDAAANAKQLIELLGLDYEGLAPRQLDLF